MNCLYSVKISVGDCNKEIAVYYDDVTTFEQEIDILTTSAFVKSYSPTPMTIFEALDQKGINVKAIAQTPEIDLRDPCNVWLSQELPRNFTKINRIGCIELLDSRSHKSNISEQEQAMINSIRAYFKMLDIASVYNVKMSTVALPLLGGGAQKISSKLLLVPLINECIAFLKRNSDVKKILFIDINFEKATAIANSLKQSLRFLNSNISNNFDQDRTVFLSYSSADKNVADNLCFKLESNGFKVWYAPRDVKGPYAEAISKAIDEASLFVVILSQNSLLSEHVLNEIDLAFQRLPNHIKFKPLRIDNSMFTPSFKYYLSRQHWMDATNPPLEERLSEFVKSLLSDIT